MDQHLDVYGLMEAEQRGAKEGCSGTTDNAYGPDGYPGLSPWEKKPEHGMG